MVLRLKILKLFPEVVNSGPSKVKIHLHLPENLIESEIRYAQTGGHVKSSHIS